MALNGPGLKAKMAKSIKAGLARNFSDVSGTSGYSGISEAQWVKIADAVSDIALDIVLAMTTEAQVAPGIATAGGPTNQVTVAPGQII